MKKAAFDTEFTAQKIATLDFQFSSFNFQAIALLCQKDDHSWFGQGRIDYKFVVV
jgi:hypothetical protein